MKNLTTIPGKTVYFWTGKCWKPAYFLSFGRKLAHLQTWTGKRISCQISDVKLSSGGAA